MIGLCGCSITLDRIFGRGGRWERETLMLRKEWERNLDESNLVGEGDHGIGCRVSGSRVGAELKSDEEGRQEPTVVADRPATKPTIGDATFLLLIALAFATSSSTLEM